ncbi:hypothetical protein CIRG_07654 [Coccidioides immitis RMSCC 2394]|uniref:Uncharacterized protein n=1 Tax=Coccidioides immitis RMSCC 2394 TaxID=404692 RepID=A0A0J6YM22_COCIT|nr:hypothetical protein CIRG_07654 [Coccidioides immitis RMSCC 2394]
MAARQHGSFYFNRLPLVRPRLLGLLGVDRLLRIKYLCCNDTSVLFGNLCWITSQGPRQAVVVQTHALTAKPQHQGSQIHDGDWITWAIPAYQHGASGVMSPPEE